MQNTFSGLFPVSFIKETLRRGGYDEKLMQFYGVSGAALKPYAERICDALDRFTEMYGEREVCIFSVSGRTELGGNHTDHQHGHVLAAGVSLDIIAVAAPTEDGSIRVRSEGYPEDCVQADQLDIRPEEAGTSAALIRGTAARFSQLGKPVSGFCAYTVSTVLKGSGLSSSAAFEVMIGTICNDFYAQNSFSLAELAMIAQFTENTYFMKPCGLMDQMACALGGAVAIDFADSANPVWEQIPFDLNGYGYALCIIDSGADHADLTDEYAAIPAEMKAAARCMGAETLSETDPEEFLRKLPEIRKACGDRAVMRAFHFYEEDRRAVSEAEALRIGTAGAFEALFLPLVQESGASSAFALQNIYASGSREHQAVAVTIALCKTLLGDGGVCRVHGGGFAGTVQAYVPLNQVETFRAGVEAILGTGSCHVLQIRACGASALWSKTSEDN